MGTYRLKKNVGKHRMRDDEGNMQVLNAGDVVDLSDEQFRACQDKFEPSDQLAGPSSDELFKMAQAKKEQEDAAAEEKAKAEAIANQAKQKAVEKAAKAEAANAKAATQGKG